MTNDERATIYGRAMLDLKECQSGIAALVAFFSDYSEKLQRAQAMAKQFASDPLGFAGGHIRYSEVVKQENLQLTRADMAEKVNEFVKLVERSRELKEQIDKF